MQLTPGTRLGPYEILSPIGAGGMGEVYQARDTRLDRTVAIKVLPPAFAADVDRRQRFEQEARLVASLNHPHICALHDIGSAPAAGANHPATAYLVMEYLDGETLASRIARGPIPLEESIRYGRDIAFALDAAHRQRIVHRDLKPGNIMLTRAGVKLLDFGLAKAMDPPLESVGSASTMQIAAVTTPGTVLGTVPYMAPEQVQGRATDSRSDIFALGAVIYEMATGRRAFGGDSPAAVASSILTFEPPALTTSPSLERIVRACLAKDPERRWQSAYDIALQLATVEERAAADHARPSRAPALPWALAAVATVIALAGGVAAWRGRSSASTGDLSALRGAMSFVVPPPPHGSFAPTVESNFLSISPDGTHVAFAVLDQARTPSIWVRSLASHEAKSLAGTAGATAAFWSPDGKSIAYFAAGKLKRVNITGGAPVMICDVREGIGQTGTWGAKDEILFASVQGEAIMRVSATGVGTPSVELLRADPARNERRTAWPSFLPNGHQFLYLAGLADDTGAVMLGDLDGSSREVMRVKSLAQYVNPGFIVFAQDSALLARRFDTATGQVSGDPIQIAERVNAFLGTGAAHFAASFNGVIAYQSHVDQSRIASFDRQGRATGTVRPEGRYQALRVSADGRRMLFDRVDPRTTTYDVWLLEMDRGVETRLTSEIGTEIHAMWAPNDTIIYAATRGRPPQLFRRSLASGADDPLSPKGLVMQVSPDLSPDGTSLIYAERANRGTFDLLTMSLADRRPVPFRASPADEGDGRFSPDGRFVAYASDESGRGEVYIEPFPSSGSRHIVSSDGGRLPRWSRDGRELFYLSADAHLMSVPIRLSPSLQIGKAFRLFPPTTAWRWIDYDVSAAGQFIASVPTQVASEQPLTVIVNWPAAVAR